jgi:predicted transposase YbfD/YdcC
VRGHWELDVNFREDTNRVYKDHAPANLSIIRHMALNLIRQDPAKGSFKNKRRKAGWNKDYF